ncbi:hypothetical protein [Aquimarina sp. Aq107]|uniref:hypothetical protein n=1 Tax=Aquimarina sp. Aq107 TaxID=1191912 RepID=UPI0020B1B859|nr:hypothetical protein [Aquimarina sp. Aq107]
MQSNYVKDQIRQRHGTIRSYYNEIFRLFINKHYLEENNIHEDRYIQLSRWLVKLTIELNEFGADHALNIIKTIKKDAEFYYSSGRLNYASKNKIHT